MQQGISTKARRYLIPHILYLLPRIVRVTQPVLGKCPFIWNRLQSLRRRVMGQTQATAENTWIISPGSRQAPSFRNLEFGVNLAGYLHADTGLGESARSIVRMLKVENIPYILNNVYMVGSKMQEHVDGKESTENPYAINIVNVTAPYVSGFVAQMGEEYFRNRYNIALWAWEFSKFPDEWVPALRYFNEIWCVSSFAADAVSRVSDIPVISMPHCMPEVLPKSPQFNRSKFGLGDSFTFLFVFDFYSNGERKNPLGLIKAFRLAFEGVDGVQLLIKSNHKEQEMFTRMKETAAGLPIRFFDGSLKREELNSLVAACDCYVSLHRAEGFGLTLAEAMLAGKPVITTGYSGNMDFTTVNNSFMVKYNLIGLKNPYEAIVDKDLVWAEPDIQHAAQLMQYVYNYPEEAAAVGKKAREDILTYYSPSAIGKKMSDRLRRIYR